MGKKSPETFYFILAAALIILFALSVVYPRIRTQETKSSPSASQAIQQQSKTTEQHLELANKLVKEKKWDGAIKEFQKAIAKQPNLAMAHYKLGMLLAQNNQIDRAIASFETALKLEPKNKKIKQTLEFYYKYLK